MSLDKAAGGTFTLDELTKTLQQHKPAVLFLCQVTGLPLPQWRTLSGVLTRLPHTLVGLVHACQLCST